MIIFSFQIGGKVKSVSGSPGEVIIKVSKEENASIIVSGTRGMGTIRKPFSWDMNTQL
jgi:nucleotide-binding universal stress UspA family protein